MIYKGHVIEKMADVYKKTFSVRLKKHLFRVGYCWYLIVL